jgi:hypothetical protein
MMPNQQIKGKPVTFDTLRVGKTLFHQGWEQPWRCYNCDKYFERDGWSKWKEVTTK